MLLSPDHVLLNLLSFKVTIRLFQFLVSSALKLQLTTPTHFHANPILAWPLDKRFWLLYWQNIPQFYSSFFLKYITFTFCCIFSCFTPFSFLQLFAFYASFSYFFNSCLIDGISSLLLCSSHHTNHIFLAHTSVSTWLRTSCCATYNRSCVFFCRLSSMKHL